MAKLNIHSLIARAAALLAVSGFSASALPQFASQNIQLKANIGLAAFGADNGNDCWGYTSPSGREYALMGLSNKVAFIEITNPAAPVWFASVSHIDSLWADIKTYQGYAYVCTEASDSGLQVIDIRNLDNHQVSLVRTITSPGRSHTLALDEVSGYLYTCGSRQSSGTTTCFSLANPSNPVQVGSASLTDNYIHAMQVVTYTSGPYAGRQIGFCCSEGRGLDIYDFTNKSATFMIKRASYPDVGYCHQGWLSADRKLFYIDDEFDESNTLGNTRTIIINVEDLNNAAYVTSFSTGLPSIDHNLFVKDGFVFEANYRSGLRVFDTWPNPTAPVQTGWIDTYPANDGRGYDGAWGNYPFFKDGKVIISDLDRGFFLVDVTAATTRTILSNNLSVMRGFVLSGGLADLHAADNSVLRIRNGITVNAQEAPIQAVIETTAPPSNHRIMKIENDALGSAGGLQQTVELFNFATNAYETVNVRVLGTSMSGSVITIGGDPARFVRSADSLVRAKISYRPTTPVLSSQWSVSIDRFLWKMTP
jgi:choice-of-anchor B domain-containing protein